MKAKSATGELNGAQLEEIWRVAQLGGLELQGPVAPPMILWQMRGEPGFPFKGVPWRNNRPLCSYPEQAKTAAQLDFGF